jgi:hypothetical protein
VQSFVTEGKITCVYIASSTELVLQHARLGGFPADRVLEVATIIDPTTAEPIEPAASAGNHGSGVAAGRLEWAE